VGGKGGGVGGGLVFPKLFLGRGGGWLGGFVGVGVWCWGLSGGDSSIATVKSGAPVLFADRGGKNETSEEKKGILVRNSNSFQKGRKVYIKNYFQQ